MDNSPRYFVLEPLAQNKYLRFVHEDALLHGHLEFSGEEAISPYTKYELEPAKAISGLFNIRCCYNNKYWTRSEESTGWITATAKEPVEDPFKWSCTLFEASIVLYQTRVRVLKLALVQHGRNAPVSFGSGGGGDPKYISCLKADANAPILPDDSNALFPFTDFESFVILPRQVMFKADNGLYISQDGSALVIKSNEVASPYLQHEVLYTRRGDIHIKCLATRNFWRPTGNNISVQPNVIENDQSALFSVRKAPGEDEVALWNNSPAHNFCQRLSVGIDANASYMAKETILRVEEPVAFRSIYNVDFRLRDARIYNQTPVLLVSKRLSNPLDVDKVTNVTETFTKETTRTWKSSVSLKLATPTTIETEIPLIVDGEVSLWDKGPHQWGTDVKGSQTIEVSDDITIPAKSVVMVHVIVTRGMCDVPFSYRQRDRDINGYFRISKMEDGVYTGSNYYNLKTKVVKIC